MLYWNAEIVSLFTGLESHHTGVNRKSQGKFSMSMGSFFVCGIESFTQSENTILFHMIIPSLMWYSV